MIYAFITLTFVLLVVVEIFTVLFRMTGLSEHRSRFQVISMLTGVGFTTRESESILTNKVRRNLAQAAILLGYSASATLISIFVNLYTRKVTLTETLVVVGYILAVLVVMRLTFVRKGFDHLIETLADHYMRRLDRNKLHTLSHHGTAVLAEVTLVRELPLMQISLKDLDLGKKKNIRIINIERMGESLNNPGWEDCLLMGDRVMMFGPPEAIREVFETF